jgi:hypothetical protein
MTMGNAEAGTFHLPHGEAEAIAKIAKIQTSSQDGDSAFRSLHHELLEISSVPLLDSRLYFAAEGFPSIGVDVRYVRFVRHQPTARPCNSANDKLKFTSLQRTFAPAQNCDPGESIVRSSRLRYPLLSCPGGNSPRISRP